MFKHDDYCTLLKNPDDADILTRQLFDVNVRLFYSSKPYQDIVTRCCEYIRWCAITEKDGYKKPHGYSGANAGIPFNIVGLANGNVLVNPYVIKATGKRVSVSNCGSLLLDKPIKIWRYAHVEVRTLLLNEGPALTELFLSGYLPTVQHEIDHNNGILIYDRQVA